MTLQELSTSVITLLTRVGSNRVTASEILLAVQQVIAYFATQLADIIPDWTDSATFKLDGTSAGKYCKYPDSTGKKRIFETKVDNNINHLPPTDPGITENTYWKEVSASAAAAIPEYAAGIYGPGLVIVFHNHSVDGRGLYVLLDPVRPYSSTNIETEITAGKWERIGGSTGGGGGTWGSITGTVTDQTDLTTYIAAQIAALVASAPGALDTLNELAAALGNDPNFATTITTALGNRELTANKDVSGGYVGLSGWSIKFRNLANSFTSLLQNAATAVRTYTFPDKNITVAGIDDITSALKKKTSVSANFSIAAINDTATITVDAAVDVTCTVDTLPADSWVGILNKGIGGVNFVAGSGVTILGATSLPGNVITGAWIFYVSSTVVCILSGSSVAFSSVTGRPTTINGYSISDSISGLHLNITPVGNVGAGLDTLYTYPIPGGTISANGQRVIGFAKGKFAANANTKRLVLEFGGVTIYDSGALAISTLSDWRIDFDVLRISNTSQQCTVTARSSSGALVTTTVFADTTSAFTGSISIIVKGEATADNDITATSFKVLKEGSI